MQLLNTVRWANLALRLLLEMCVFALFAFWDWHVGTNLPLKIALTLGLLLLVIAVWGVMLSPRASVPLPTVPWVVLQIVIFGAAVAGLATAGRSRLALLLATFLVVNSALLVVWRR